MSQVKQNIPDPELAMRIELRHSNIQAVTQVGEKQLIMQVNEGTAQGDPTASSIYVNTYTGVQDEIDTVRTPINNFTLQMACNEHPIPTEMAQTLVVDDHAETHLLPSTNNPETIIQRIKSIVQPILTTQENWGINSNRDKTILLINLYGKGSNKCLKKIGNKIKLDDGTSLNIVNTFTYVGVNIGGTNNGDNLEVQARINKSNEAMTRLNNVWKNKKLDTKTKILLHSSTVESILKYGTAQRAYSDAQLQKLEAVHQRNLRRIARSPAHIEHESNVEVRERLSVPSLTSQLRYQRLRWIQRLQTQNDQTTLMAILGTEISEGQIGQYISNETHPLANLYMKDIITLHKVLNIPHNITNPHQALATISQFTKSQLQTTLTSDSELERSQRKKYGPQNQPTFFCETCTKGFCTNLALQSHKNSAHKRRMPIRQLVIPDTTQAGRYTCMLCNKSFKDKHGAQEHIQRICAPKHDAAHIQTLLDQHAQPNVPPT
jgi:hypothetical protein